MQSHYIEAGSASDYHELVNTVAVGQRQAPEGEVMGGLYQACSTRKRQRRSLEQIAYHLLSERWCGNDDVPLCQRTLYVPSEGCQYVFCFLNDAFEIGIGWPNKWHGLYRREVINRFIRWYLWQWAWAEWFGLRRRIWYWLLNRRVQKTILVGKRANG